MMYRDNISVCAGDRVWGSMVELDRIAHVVSLGQQPVDALSRPTKKPTVRR